MPMLYYVRHGLTDWNAEGRLQGRLDVPLNDEGRRQAARSAVPASSRFPASAASRNLRTEVRSDDFAALFR